MCSDKGDSELNGRGAEPEWFGEDEADAAELGRKFDETGERVNGKPEVWLSLWDLEERRKGFEKGMLKEGLEGAGVAAGVAAGVMAMVDLLASTSVFR